MYGFDFFKLFFSILIPSLLCEGAIQEMYDREVKAFQEAWNKRHPNKKLWIHGHPYKMAIWLVNGEPRPYYTKMVRFIYANGPQKGETFTFMGSMFVSGSRFSKQYILTALEKGRINRLAKRGISSHTIQKWREARNASQSAFSQSINWARKMYLRNQLYGSDTDFAFYICLDIFLREEGRFPLWTLH